jgi:NAD(P)-dependent dehydrogenase (short-subunit alcohol dehydrogenase family)
MSLRFEGKVLFTTGAGSGLAREVARRFSREGGRVAVADLNADHAKATAAELTGALALAVDVTSEDGVAEAVRQAHQHFGRIDCAFNAAGIADFGPIEEWSLARWNRMFAVHVGGTFLVCKNVLPIMRAQGGGAIVNMASSAALSAQLNNAPYGAAKGAIVSFSRQLALEAAPLVRVNVVAPGGINTAMTQPLYLKRGDGDLKKGAALTAQRNVMKRVGEPDEVAAPVCHLLSDESSFITGHVLVIDGGKSVV